MTESLKTIFHLWYKGCGLNLFPLGYQISVSIALIQAELIQFFRYFLPAVIKIINISTLLMRYLKYRPQCLTLSLPIMSIIFSCQID